MTRTFENAVKAIKPDKLPAACIIPSPYDMSQEDLAGLIRMAASGDLAKAIIMAFDFGFVMGNRATISRKLKRL